MLHGCFWSQDKFLHQIIFYHVQQYFAVCDKFDPVGCLVCVDRCGDHLFPLVDKNLRAEAVQDHAQGQFSVLMADLASALVDHRPAGTGELAVDLHDGIGGMEAECRMEVLIFGKPDAEFLIKIFSFSRSDGNGQIDLTSMNTIQTQFAVT